MPDDGSPHGTLIDLEITGLSWTGYAGRSDGPSADSGNRRPRKRRSGSVGNGHGQRGRGRSSRNAPRRWHCCIAADVHVSGSDRTHLPGRHDGRPGGPRHRAVSGLPTGHRPTGLSRHRLTPPRSMSPRACAFHRLTHSGPVQQLLRIRQACSPQGTPRRPGRHRRAHSMPPGGFPESRPVAGRRTQGP